VRLQSGSGYLIEAVNGRERTVIERCDTQQHAALRQATLTEAAWRIQLRLDARAEAPVRARRLPPREERERLHYPRVSLFLPPPLVDWLLTEAKRRQLDLSGLAIRLLGVHVDGRRMR
jgi:hypothetical protein